MIEGGLNESYVAIRLTPERDYDYICEIIILGKERQTDCQQR